MHILKKFTEVFNLNNKNDSMKEKAIEKNELESVSGGFWVFDRTGTYYVAQDICAPPNANYTKDNNADCIACYKKCWAFQPGKVWDGKGNFSHTLVIDSQKCFRCNACIEQNWCHKGAIKWSPT
jgi:NAD-dependent dihydropyrimidine dehydrogenase PreA subunit